MRIERILDESRQIFPAMTRARWAAMALCAVPLIYLAAVVRPARVRAQEPPVSPASQPKRFFIQGDVKRPGEYKLTAPTRILKALVDAGGFRESAKTADIVIIRYQSGAAQHLHFNYEQVARGENLNQNIWLQPGDIIVVR